MNTTHKKSNRITIRIAAMKTRGRSRKLEVVDFEGKAAKKHTKDAVIYAKAVKVLRPAGTPLLIAVSRYVEAVKILGGDRVLEAARNFARQNSIRRKRPTVRKVRKVSNKSINLKTRRITARKSEPIAICTPTELRALLAATPGWFRASLVIQAFAGLRCSELLRLYWEDVKLNCGHIEVRRDRTKAAARRLAPVPPNLVRWLTRAAKSSGKVFPYSQTNFDEIRAKTTRTAEIALKHDALRHSFISYRVAQTSDVPRVSLESGAPPGAIFKHYRTLAGEMDARQWFTIIP
jgi:integrase